MDYDVAAKRITDFYDGEDDYMIAETRVREYLCTLFPEPAKDSKRYDAEDLERAYAKGFADGHGPLLPAVPAPAQAAPR